MLMGDLHSCSPLVHEATWGVEATVPYACFPLKVLAHAVTIVVVAHARLLCKEVRLGVKMEICFLKSNKAYWPTPPEKQPFQLNIDLRVIYSVNIK